MNGFDIQSATEVAECLTAIVQNAVKFNHDRTRILEEILLTAEDYTRLAICIDQAHSEEAV